MIERKATITIDEVEYEARLARVANTHLGLEDHGILSVNLTFEGVDGGWGQGTGHYFADTPARLFPRVTSFITFFGRTWEAITGAECYVLWERPSGPIAGLAGKSNDAYLLFSEVSAAVEANEKSAE